jgi:hypothetical protein
MVAGGDTCGLPFSVEITEITFLLDNGMYRNAGPGGWGVGAIYGSLDWKSENNPDHPVSYARNRAMRMRVKLKVTGEVEGTATLKVVTPFGTTGTADFSVPCGEGSAKFDITTNAIPASVSVHDLDAALEWLVKPPGGANFNYFVGNTFHRVYITYDVPSGSKPTPSRMSWLCDKAWNAWNERSIADGIHVGLADPEGGDVPPLGGHGPIGDPNQIDHWWLMSGGQYYGECDEQARFMNLAMRALGAPSGTIHWIRASTDAYNVEDIETTTAAARGISIDLDKDGSVGDETLKLYFDFDPPRHDINYFEAVLFVAGRYYAVWPNLVADTPCRMLREIKTVTGRAPENREIEQLWVYEPTAVEISRGAVRYVHPTNIDYPTCP